MARRIAWRLKRLFAWVEWDELYSYALMGLTLAARAYEPGRSASFGQFAAKKALFLAIDEMRRARIVRRSGQKRLPVALSGCVSLADSQRQFDPPSKSAEQDMRRLEARDLVAPLMARLRVGQRQLLLMRYVDGMTFREIAEVRNVSVTTVYLHHRAILRGLRRSAGIGQETGTRRADVS